MISRTYGQVKAFLAEYAGNTGMQVDDARLLAYTNRAIRELMNEGEWPGVVDQWYLRVDSVGDGLLTLPSMLDRMMHVTLDGTPKEIRSPWFEFYQYGPGNVHNEELDGQGNVITAKVNWRDWAVDRGTAATRYDIPMEDGPWSIRVYATVDESVGGVNPEVKICGLDSNGDEVRSAVIVGSSVTYVTGESIEIDFDGMHESTGSFSKIYSVVKPVTNGPVRITAWNGVTEVELSRLEWRETNPNYRRYYIPELFKDTDDGKDKIIRARCRRKFVEIEDDDDTLIIGNELALSEMIIAQYKRQVNAGDEYVMHKQTAIDIMRKESTAHLGKVRTPAFTMQKGYSLTDRVGIIR